MSERIKLMVVSARALHGSYTKQFESHGSFDIMATIENPSEAFHKIDLYVPDLVLLDIGEQDDSLLAFVERTSRTYPLIPLIVVSQTSDVHRVRQYMRSGARDFLATEEERGQVATLLKGIYQREQERTGHQTMAVLEANTVRKSTVIALISAKGGVGKSTLSMNLAAAFALQGRRTALVDFDLQFGDASLLSNCVPEKTVIDLVQESSDMDADVVEQFMVTHQSGVRLLCTGKRPEEAEYVTPAHVRTIVQALRKNYDYIIVDTAPLANDVFFAVLDSVDERLMVSTLNLAVIKNNRLLLDLLSELDYDVADVKHILNRANAKNGIKVHDVEQVLKTHIYSEVDNDYQFVETAANEGTLFIQKDPLHRLTKQIYALTVKLEQSQGRVVSRKNPLSGWISRISR